MSDRGSEEIVISTITELIQNKEREVEELNKKLEALKIELSSLQQTKTIFLKKFGDQLTETTALEDTQSNDECSVDSRGTPEDWLFPQFQVIGSKKAIEQILEEKQAAVAIEELVRVLYDTQSIDEFRRARNSMSAALRRGADEGLWKKVGRRFYVANSVKSDPDNFSLEFANKVESDEEEGSVND